MTHCLHFVHAASIAHVQICAASARTASSRTSLSDREYEAFAVNNHEDRICSPPQDLLADEDEFPAKFGRCDLCFETLIDCHASPFSLHASTESRRKRSWRVCGSRATASSTSRRQRLQQPHDGQPPQLRRQRGLRVAAQTGHRSARV